MDIEGPGYCQGCNSSVTGHLEVNDGLFAVLMSATTYGFGRLCVHAHRGRKLSYNRHNKQTQHLRPTAQCRRAARHRRSVLGDLNKLV